MNYIGTKPGCSDRWLLKSRFLRFAGWHSRAWLVVLVLAGSMGSSRVGAALQFDAFLGFDGVIPEACWFPLVFEVKNDGPAFNGTIEITSGNLGRGTAREVQVELPTGTLKRLVVPVFASARGFTTWDARLFDDRGKLRAEQSRLQPRKQIAAEVPLLGAIPRTPSGAPQLRAVLPQQQELQPATARLLPGLFPDNPLVLERMNALYLNSERVVDLSVAQVEALLSWLYSGGNLIVGIEQPSDIGGVPWLKAIFPCDLNEMRSLTNHSDLHQWITQLDWPVNPRLRFGRQTSVSGSVVPPLQNPFSTLPAEMAFEAEPMQVINSQVRDGYVVAGSDSSPLIVRAPRGRGQITVLLFSPEREPVRSWKHLPVFWARMAGVPANLYASSDFTQAGGWSSDGVFGAMLDSRQVHKLPIGWLLMLLLVYLLVIGPVDHYWLKRIGRPMLTWVTFPCYVVLFSFVIYLIGYKLRAGESEWNELHLVDVMPKAKGQSSFLRGRSYISVYSPSNQRYKLEGQQDTSMLRSEFAGMWGTGQNDDESRVTMSGSRFKAEVFVPVWTSRLLVSDWCESAATPVSVSVTQRGSDWRVSVQNRTASVFTNVHFVYQDRLVSLGPVPAQGTASFSVSPGQGTLLREFVWKHSSSFQQAVQSRQYAFGQARTGWLEDRQGSAISLSFISHAAPTHAYQSSFVMPPGLELSPILEQGQAVLLAWAEGFSPAKPMRQFTPRRTQQFTLLRVATPLP